MVLQSPVKGYCKGSFKGSRGFRVLGFRGQDWGSGFWAFKASVLVFMRAWDVGVPGGEGLLGLELRALRARSRRSIPRLYDITQAGRQDHECVVMLLRW